MEVSWLAAQGSSRPWVQRCRSFCHSNQPIYSWVFCTTSRRLGMSCRHLLPQLPGLSGQGLRRTSISVQRGTMESSGIQPQRQLWRAADDDDAAPPVFASRGSRGGRGRARGGRGGQGGRLGQGRQHQHGEKRERSESARRATAQPDGERHRQRLQETQSPSNQHGPKGGTDQFCERPFTTLAVSPLTLQAIAEDFQYESMSRVQALAIEPCLTGSDTIVKAKTGTGKTLAFLIPTLERILSVPPHQRRGRVSALILSPTRELAQQIGSEGSRLIGCHRGLRVQVMFGGTNVGRDVKAFTSLPPDILVATPGRLIDHLENSNLAPLLGSLQVLIFDEGDQLLDMGFKPAITTILKMLPPKDTYQTLVFSATMPQDLSSIIKMACAGKQHFVDCVGQEQATHQHVPQGFMVVQRQQQFNALAALLEDARRNPAHKIIVFFTTARLTQFYAELFEACGVPVVEMHSKKTQSYRTRESDRFRAGSGMTMFSSDVSARGLDYPGVTQIIQVGMPTDKAQYIHRLGRTARGGEGGSGLILLCDFEAGFLEELQGLPLQENKPSQQRFDVIEPRMKQALQSMSRETGEKAYQAWLGYYNGALKRLRWSKEDLVAAANDWISVVGQPVPTMDPQTLGKMRLRGVKGIKEGPGGRGGRGGEAQRGGRGRGPWADRGGVRGGRF